LRDLPEGCYEAVIQPRPAYYDEVTEGQGPWGGGWSRPGSWDPGTRAARGGGTRAPSFAAKPRSTPSKPAGSPPGELTVHYDDDAGGDESHGLRIGAKVRHPQFGVGDVRGWQAAGPDSKDLKVTVRFPTVGVKTILARFLTRA
jgi:hypothetical protein